MLPKTPTLFLLFYTLASCTDDYLENYNRNELFAPPTQQEINAVLADWNSRDLSPKNYKVEQSVEISGDATLKIISYNISGFKEYAALLIPKANKIMPVRVYIGGFGIDITVNSITLVGTDTFTGDPFIFAIPALRGQSLDVNINGTHYTSPISEGEHCDAFDRGADDGIALINVIGSTEPKADVNRVSVRGGSRGATVALLIGARDTRVKMAIGVAGPSNLLELISQSTNDQTYRCQFLERLVQGSYSVPEARLNMVASSPLFFADRLPKTQYHLAADDRIVPVSQGSDMQSAVNGKGHSDLFELFIYEGRDHSNIANDNDELNKRIEDMLKGL